MPHLFPSFTSGSRNGICLISTGSIVAFISPANESIVNKGDSDNDHQDVQTSLLWQERLRFYRPFRSPDHYGRRDPPRLSILSTQVSRLLQKRQDLKLGEIKKSNKDQETWKCGQRCKRQKQRCHLRENLLHLKRSKSWNSQKWMIF